MREYSKKCKRFVVQHPKTGLYMERAKEIASGLVSGMMERDEEVLEMVKKIKEEEK